MKRVTSLFNFSRRAIAGHWLPSIIVALTMQRARKSDKKRRRRASNRRSCRRADERRSDLIPFVKLQADRGGGRGVERDAAR